MDVASLIPQMDIGQSINIQRSDGKGKNCLNALPTSLQAREPVAMLKVVVFYWDSGRVHEAAITSVDEERLIVAVEWFENGETKGKEVSNPSTRTCTNLVIMLGSI